MQNTNRRTFLRTAIAVSLAPWWLIKVVRANQDLPIIVPKNKVLSTIFKQFTLLDKPGELCRTVPILNDCVYARVMHDNKIAVPERFCNKIAIPERFYNDADNVTERLLIPMYPKLTQEQLNTDALNLLLAAANDNKHDVVHPTHEVRTEYGVLQIDLTNRDNFVFVEMKYDRPKSMRLFYSASTVVGMCVLDNKKIKLKKEI